MTFLINWLVVGFIVALIDRNCISEYPFTVAEYVQLILLGYIGASCVVIVLIGSWLRPIESALIVENIRRNKFTDSKRIRKFKI